MDTGYQYDGPLHKYLLNHVFESYLDIDQYHETYLPMSTMVPDPYAIADGGYIINPEFDYDLNYNAAFELR